MTYWGSAEWVDEPWGGLPGAADFTPLLLYPLLFFRAASIGQADNTLVMLWRDESGNGNDITAVGPFAPPLYRIESGLSSVEFDGGDDLLLSASFAHGIGAGEFSAWFLIKPVDVTSASFWFVGDGTGAIGLATTFGGKLLFDTTGGDTPAATTLVTETWYSIILTRTSAGLLTAYINGVADAVTPTVTVSIPTSPFYLGAGGGAPMACRIISSGMTDYMLSAHELDLLTGYLTGLIPPEVVVVPYLATIDWTNKGNYGGPFDDVTLDIRHRPGISIQRGKDSVRPRSPMMVPSGSFDLGNVSRRYSTENASSPLFGIVAPDRPVQIAMSTETISPLTMRPLITGAIDEPEQQPGRDERSVRIEFLGKTAMLKGDEISTILYQQIRTDEAVTVILDAVGWPDGARALSSGDTVMNYWWLDNEDPWSALEELLETEGTGASMYESGDAFFHFENRNYRDMNARSTAVQGIFKETAPDDELAYQHFNYVPGMKEIYNTVRITTVERILAALGKAWDAGKPVSLSASESRTLFATSSDPWTNVQDVTVTTDYVVLSGSLASVTTSVVSATKVSITVTAGASGAIVVGPAADPASGPQLRAQVAAVTAEPEVSVTSVGDIVTRAKTLSLTDKLRREISPGYAQSLCNVALAYYNDSRPIIAVEFQGISDERLEQIAEREVSDRINVEEPITGVDRDIHIEQINHAINVGGLDHRCALIGSAAPAVNAPGLWGVTTNGGWGTAEWTD